MGTKEIIKPKVLRLTKRAKPTRAELEARLTAKQLAVWRSLQRALEDVKNGTSEPMSWEDFKKELADEGYTT
jgi:hypothetical protein